MIAINHSKWRVVTCRLLSHYYYRISRRTFNMSAKASLNSPELLKVWCVAVFVNNCQPPKCDVSAASYYRSTRLLPSRSLWQQLLQKFDSQTIKFPFFENIPPIRHPPQALHLSHTPHFPICPTKDSWVGVISTIHDHCNSSLILPAIHPFVRYP